MHTSDPMTPRPINSDLGILVFGRMEQGSPWNWPWWTSEILPESITRILLQWKLHTSSSFWTSFWISRIRRPVIQKSGFGSQVTRMWMMTSGQSFGAISLGRTTTPTTRSTFLPRWRDWRIWPQTPSARRHPSIWSFYSRKVPGWSQESSHVYLRFQNQTSRRSWDCTTSLSIGCMIQNCAWSSTLWFWISSATHVEMSSPSLLVGRSFVQHG